MALPRVLITGASGFIGRRVLELLRHRFEIHAMGRRSREEVGIEDHPHVTWYQMDIADCAPLTELFHHFRDQGGMNIVLHLAAHYDFTGEDHPEYWRTNVEGLQYILDLSRALHPDLFVFASSVAACAFPPPGESLTESSPPDGDHIYAKTKRIAEETLREYEKDFKSCVVRFGALFSDWCEYPPLFVFLDTWLSRRWNHRILGGRGRSAIPYLHVDDAALFLKAVIRQAPDIVPGEVLLCSTDGAVSHAELYEAATAYTYGAARKPILMPRLLCGPGMWVMDLVGRMIGSRPFERPWMARYIDKALTVDASQTRARLNWAPRPRLEILRRMPFALENMRTDPVEWRRRNHEAMEVGYLRPNVRLYYMLERAKPEITAEFTNLLTAPEAEATLAAYRRVSPEDHAWHHTLLLQSLMTAIRARDKSIFMTYCHDLAERRWRQGFPKAQVITALEAFHDLCVGHLRRADGFDTEMEQPIQDYITSTMQFGCDNVEDVYERLALEDPT